MGRAETESGRSGPHGGYTETTAPEPFVDAEKAAEFLSFRRRRVLELAHQGEIPAHPFGQAKTPGKLRLSELAVAVISHSKNKSCSAVQHPCRTVQKPCSTARA
jgi:hypothetical protein